MSVAKPRILLRVGGRVKKSGRLDGAPPTEADATHLQATRWVSARTFNQWWSPPDSEPSSSLTMWMTPMTVQTAIPRMTTMVSAMMPDTLIPLWLHATPWQAPRAEISLRTVPETGRFVTVRGRF